MVPVEQANLLRTVLRQHSGVLGPEIPVQQRLRPPELGERARPVVPFVGESLQPRPQPTGGAGARRAMVRAVQERADGGDRVAHAGVVERDAMVLSPEATFGENG